MKCAQHTAHNPKFEKMGFYTHAATSYHQISSIIHTKSKNLNVSHFVQQLSLLNPLRPGVKSLKKEDVVRAVETGNAPTTSEWSTSLLPTKVHLILEVWQYYLNQRPIYCFHGSSTSRHAHMPWACRSCPRAHKHLWLHAQLGKRFFSPGMYLFSQQNT